MSAPPVIYDESPEHDPETCPARYAIRDARAWGAYAYETAGRLRAALVGVRDTLPPGHAGYRLVNDALRVDAKPRVYLTAVEGSSTLRYHLRESCALDSLTNPRLVPAYVGELAGEPCPRCAPEGVGAGAKRT